VSDQGPTMIIEPRVVLLHHILTFSHQGVSKLSNDH
jgi:hypothetical protein